MSRNSESRPASGTGPPAKLPGGTGWPTDPQMEDVIVGPPPEVTLIGLVVNKLGSFNGTYPPQLARETAKSIGGAYCLLAVAEDFRDA